VIFKLYFFAKAFISSIFSYQIPKPEVNQPVDIALKAQSPVPGFILTQIS
jgi:hypothetical protein